MSIWFCFVFGSLYFKTFVHDSYINTWTIFFLYFNGTYVIYYVIYTGFTFKNFTELYIYIYICVCVNCWCIYKLLTYCIYMFLFMKLIGMLSAPVLQCRLWLSSQNYTWIIEQRKYITALQKQFVTLKTHKIPMAPGILSSMFSVYYIQPNDILCVKHDRLSFNLV
jgi:hypothetical protein